MLYYLGLFIKYACRWAAEGNDRKRHCHLLTTVKSFVAYYTKFVVRPYSERFLRYLHSVIYIRILRKD